jgi:hypothetical protein
MYYTNYKTNEQKHKWSKLKIGHDRPCSCQKVGIYIYIGDCVEMLSKISAQMNTLHRNVSFSTFSRIVEMAKDYLLIATYVTDIAVTIYTLSGTENRSHQNQNRYVVLPIFITVLS